MGRGRRQAEGDGEKKLSFKKQCVCVGGGPRDQTQVVSLGRKHPYPLSSLASFDTLSSHLT